MAKKKTQLAQITKSQKPNALSLANPQDVMSFGNTLKGFIKDNKLSVKIGDTDYSMVDGWKFAGLNFGLTAIPEKPKAISKQGEYITVLYSQKEFTAKNKTKYFKEVAIFAGFSAHTEILNEIRKREKITREFTKPYFAYECDCVIEKLSNHSKVSRGTGMCSNLELLKSGFDEYSVISMAETRSIGKAYRNLLGFVMKAAGVEPTPAEEMTEDGKFENITVETIQALPEPSAKQFSELMKRCIKEGETAFVEAQKHFRLTEDQISALRISLPK
jgi:hypothetical protein